VRKPFITEGFSELFRTEGVRTTLLKDSRELFVTAGPRYFQY
jgi:hypothetical protein